MIIDIKYLDYIITAEIKPATINKKAGVLWRTKRRPAKEGWIRTLDGSMSREDENTRTPLGGEDLVGFDSWNFLRPYPMPMIAKCAKLVQWKN